MTAPCPAPRKPILGRTCALALAVAAIVVHACTCGPISMRGKMCDSDFACGEGLACLGGVCLEPGDGGLPGEDAGCDLRPPPLCPPGEAFCTDRCLTQSVNRCTDACVVCPGGNVARCTGNNCAFFCGGDAGICGASSFCQFLCPGWHDQFTAGAPGGRLAATEVVEEFGDLDTTSPQTNFLAVGSGSLGGFVLYSAISGEPWLYAPMPAKLAALDTHPTLKEAFAAGEKRVFRRTSGIWTCYPGPATPGNLTAIRYRLVGASATLYATDDQGGIYKTNDGTPTPVAWRNIVQVSPRRPFRDIAIAPNGGTGLAVGDRLLYASDDAPSSSGWLSEYQTLPTTYTEYDLHAAYRDGNTNVYAVGGRARRCSACSWEGVLLVTRNWENLAPVGMPAVRRFELRLPGATPDVWMVGDQRSVARCLIAVDGGQLPSCPTQVLDGGTGALRAVTSGCPRCAIIGGEGGILRITTTGG